MLFFYLSLIEYNEDKQKFEKLYYKYAKLMHKTAIEMLKDKHFAEDAVQDSFLKIISLLDKIKEIDSKETMGFVVIIVRNTVKDMMRRRKSQDVIFSEDITQEYEGNKAMIANYNFLENVEVEDMIKQIKKLPEIYSEVLLLKFSYGLSDKQIGSILRISHETVRKRLERARHKLADIIPGRTAVFR